MFCFRKESPQDSGDDGRMLKGGMRIRAMVKKKKGENFPDLRFQHRCISQLVHLDTFLNITQDLDTRISLPCGGRRKCSLCLVVMMS
jgi:hypothetical protein